MRELNLSEQYALIALEGQESLHSSVAKSAVLRAVTAAEVLMPVLEKEGCSLSEFAEEAEKAVQAAKNMNKKEERQIEQKVKRIFGKGRSVVRDSGSSWVRSELLFIRD